MVRNGMVQKGIQWRHSMASKLTLTVGVVLLAAMAGWAYFNIKYQKTSLIENILCSTDRLTSTIRQGTHYAMMLNSRDDITQIIQNVGKQEEIQNIRIYNKGGEIKFSNRPAEIDMTTEIEAEACYICHRSDPPLEHLDLAKRTRIFRSPQGYRLLGIITPIKNEPGCSTGDCHFHPHDKKILGALDLVVSLKETDEEISATQGKIIAFTAFLFISTSAIILIFLLRFVNYPIRALINKTQSIAKGDYSSSVRWRRKDEMGHLARAIDNMGKDIEKKQTELENQRKEYQNLFELVPCLITVQDRKYRLLRYNREFSQRFAPVEGQFCFRAYKGRTEKCDPCPVEKTFEDGLPHYAEESGINKDGTQSYWIVQTSPIRDDTGRIVAAMEISHDITERRQLEVELEKSEQKYHAIFANIPNPVFVLEPESLTILDCNESVTSIYGYPVTELVGTSFLNLFVFQDRDVIGPVLATQKQFNQVRHVHQSGRTLFVNIRVSPSEYTGKRVLLITTSDITERLETEQQLIQASKMATLGEMATGVAHELNQPLSVIKTTSSFFLRKLADRASGKAPGKAPVDEQTLAHLMEKVDSNVDRATRIINHMRQFARKSDMELQSVRLNEVLASAFEIFSQQLKVRGIDVQWDLDPDLPKIEADPQRLEQVIINLLLNARDAIEEKWSRAKEVPGEDLIRIQSCRESDQVVCRVCDTGIGIPPNMEEKIFEPFFTTKEVGKGTGLGLSISYGIVKDCRGTIRCRPNGDQGTCFILSFPVKTMANRFAEAV